MTGWKRRQREREGGLCQLFVVDFLEAKHLCLDTLAKFIPVQRGASSCPNTQPWIEVRPLQNDGDSIRRCCRGAFQIAGHIAVKAAAHTHTAIGKSQQQVSLQKCLQVQRRESANNKNILALSGLLR